MVESNTIISDPKIMLGKPVIKGTRITVELVLRKLAEGMTVDQVISAYSQLTKANIYACLQYASDTIANEEIITS
ncbi:MAG: DUF433 domain-containing protein [Cyclobacteriaceae bacterium]